MTYKLARNQQRLWATAARWPLQGLDSWALRLLASQGSRLQALRLLGFRGSWAPPLEHSSVVDDI